MLHIEKCAEEDDMEHSYEWDRFLQAQDPVYPQVLDELRQGLKRSHWMWFVFPQLRGLGASAMAQRFGISSLDEARAYLRHPVLGPRLREATRLVNAVEGRSIQDIFGYPDDLKFRSCVSLFASATPDNAVFTEALDKYFGGQADPQTVQRL
jgi:uncharacterized protein (DUF1810 family)